MRGYPQTAVERADHAAVVRDGGAITYAELDDRASRLARVLQGMGVGAGTRVVIMLPNSFEFVETLAATAKLEVSALNLNWHLLADEVAWILDDSGAVALVAHARLRPQVERVVQDRSLPVLWVGDGYDDALAAASGDPLPYRWPTSWPVIYTSGTSGRPKGVVHGATADPAVIEMVHDGLQALWGYTAEDVHLAAGPLYHAGPYGYAGLTLYAGGTLVLMDGWDARAFLATVEHHRVTTTFLTPAHFIRILEVPESERAGYDVSSLRHVIHGGAPCPRAVKERIIEALPSAEIWELYGASEGGATRVSSTDWSARPGTVGQPWPGVEIRIVDADTGARLSAGEDGLVYVRPAQGRFEYHNDPAKTADAWRDDAFSVGDIGHLDADGWLYLTDRASDLIIRSGVNVYPRAVEEVLHQHPAVVDCAVFGIPHDRDGEQPFAVVEARTPVSADDLDAWCRARLDPYACPTGYELVETLPRDPNGKVLKRLLRDAGLGRNRPTDLTMTTSDEWVPDRWLEVDGDGRAWLVGGWSPSSRHHHFPPAGVCPYSGATDVEVVRLSRSGTLWAWTAVTAAPPGYEGEVPYGFGVVELVPEGLRVIGRLTVADPDALSFGQAMEVVTETLPGGQRIWAFAPQASP